MSVTFSAAPKSRLPRPLAALVQWFDSDYTPESPEKMRASPDKVDWMRCIPFLILHAGCLGVLWVGWSPFAVAVAIALYFVRMFAVTGIYHRYFSHKTYSTSRVGQFLLALWGATTVQRGAQNFSVEYSWCRISGEYCANGIPGYPRCCEHQCTRPFSQMYK